MSLRFKAIVFISLTLLGLMAAMYAVSESVVMRGFTDLEKQTARQSAERCRAVLNDEVDALSTKLADWAAWDDTYRFIEDKNEAYIAANLQGESFNSMNVQAVLLLDPEGRTVWAGAVTADGTIGDAMPEVLQMLGRHPELSRATPDPAGVRGILALSTGTYLYSVRPILTTKAEGPSRGTIAFIRVMNEQTIERVSRLAGVSAAVSRVGSPAASADVASAEVELLGTNTPCVAYPKQGTVSGYVLLDDALGRPALVLRADSPRQVYEQGRQTVGFWYVGLAIAAVAFGSAMLILLSRFVLSPVAALSHELDDVSRKGDATRRVRADRDDELGRLARTLNRALEAVERSQRELVASESRFRTLADQAPVMIWTTDPDGRCEYVNRTWLALTGRSLAQEIGDGWMSAVHPADRARRASEMDSARCDRRPVRCEYRLRRADGADRWILDTGTPRFGVEGEFQGFIGCSVDLTERRETEERVQSSEAKFRAMFEHSPIGMVLSDPRGRVVQCNEAFARIVGRAADEMAGSELSRLVSPSDAADERSMRDELWREQRFGPVEKDLRREGGTPVPVVENAALVGRDTPSPQVWRFVQDITARRRVEESLSQYTADLVEAKTALEKQAEELSARAVELEQARAHAEAASRAKSLFLANMSHEIRTPMTAILGFADLLQDSEQSDAQRAEHVRTIRASGQHLLQLINDILDLSKIEADRLQVERIPTRPGQVLAEVCGMMRAAAERKGLTLDVGYETPIPESVIGDPTRLRQVLVNLVGNALKFTERGGVNLRARWEASAPDGARLEFEIRDTGIGMSEEQLSNLFQPFAQADASMTRRFGGTGLGLVISRRLATLMGGTLTATSSPGLGSTFVVRVSGEATTPMTLVDRFDPAAPAASAPDPNGSAVVLRGRVLLVEDGPDNRRLIAHHLRKAGAEVEMVENGLAGVEAVTAATPGRAFDLVLMDMQMPVLDGYSATRRLREAGVCTPIIALTAHAMAEDRERCLSAGCDDYASKPIDRATLLATCRAWMGRRSGRAAGEPERATDGTRTRDLKDHNLAL